SCCRDVQELAVERLTRPAVTGIGQVFKVALQVAMEVEASRSGRPLDLARKHASIVQTSHHVDLDVPSVAISALPACPIPRPGQAPRRVMTCVSLGDHALEH